MVRSPSQLSSPLPDYFHSVKISFVLWTQNWRSPVFPVQPYQCWERRITIFLNILASPLQPNIWGHAVSPHRCWLISNMPQVLFYRAAFLPRQSLAYTEAWFLLSQVKNFEFAFAELHKDFIGPFVQPFKVSLNGSPVLSIPPYVFSPACRRILVCHPDHWWHL